MLAPDSRNALFDKRLKRSMQQARATGLGLLQLRAASVWRSSAETVRFVDA
jgi:hypothetical protein